MAARLPEHRLGWDANSQWVTFAHSHEKATSLFLLCGVCLEWGKCDCISSCNRKKDEWLPLVQWIWHVMLMIQRKVYSMCTHAHLNIHEQQTHNTEHEQTLRLQKNKISISFYVHHPWRMLSCFKSTSTAQHRTSADDSSPSLPLFLSAGCEKKNNISLFLFFLFSQNKNHLLTTAGNLCPPVSQIMDVLPSSLSISCSQPLDGDAQLTNSSQLPPFWSHMIWAITK